MESLKELQEALAAAAKAAKDATAKAKTKTPAKPEKKDEGKPAPHPTKTAAGTAQAPDSFTLWAAADDANAAPPPFTPTSLPRRRRQKMTSFLLNCLTDLMKERPNNGSQDRKDDAGVRVR